MMKASAVAGSRLPRASPSRSKRVRLFFPTDAHNRQRLIHRLSRPVSSSAWGAAEHLALWESRATLLCRVATPLPFLSFPRRCQRDVKKSARPTRSAAASGTDAEGRIAKQPSQSRFNESRWQNRGTAQVSELRDPVFACGQQPPRFAAEVLNSLKCVVGRTYLRAKMATKREVLACLTAEELRGAVERCELEVQDRPSKERLIEAVAASKKATLADLLPDLPRERLKEICRELAPERFHFFIDALISRRCCSNRSDSAKLGVDGARRWERSGTVARIVR